MQAAIVSILVLAGSLAAIADAAAVDNPPGFPFSQQPMSEITARAMDSFMGTDHVGKDGPMAKLGPDLVLTYHEYRDYLARGGFPKLGHRFRPSLPLVRVAEDSVVVDMAARGDIGVLVQELRGLGMQDIAVYGRLVSGRLPVAALEAAAGLPHLRLARPAYAATRAGLVTSQGDTAMLADSARTGFGVDGTGMSVGTLSDSFDCLGGASADVASGDLPGGVVVLQEYTGCSGAIDEGRAMMQIVHDVAPGAAQAFHSAFNGQADFANGILELAAAGTDIINDDVIYYAEPMFQDGPIAQAIDTVKGMGVAYFSAAGNQARQSYEDSFRDSGQSGYRPGSTRHDYNAGGGTDGLQSVTIPGNTQVVFVLQWDDPFYSVSGGAGTDTDMDIILYSGNGRTALAGGIVSNIGGDPVEVFGILTNNGPAKTYQVGIEHVAGPSPSRIKYVFFGNMTVNEYATDSGTAYGHPAAAGGQAVGAARYTQTPAFGQSPPQLEYFSSAGGVEILFDTAGNPVNDLRQKPEIVAPDGGDTTFFYPGQDYESNGYPNFFGTSAAAPHAAGVAALLLDQDPALTPDALYTALQNTAIDMGDAGVDFDSGHGLVQAAAALALLNPDADGDGVPDGSDNCPAVANPLQENNDGDSQGDACDPDDDNDTLSDDAEINVYGTDPFLVDTDGDGFDDPVEIAAGSDPTDPGIIPGSATGDINGDGNVDLVDVLLGYRILLGDLTPDTNQILRGDVAPLAEGMPRPDGQINLGDVLLIEGKVLGNASF
jgi:subtilisin family serine protease